MNVRRDQDNTRYINVLYLIAGSKFGANRLVV